MQRQYKNRNSSPARHRQFRAALDVLQRREDARLVQTNGRDGAQFWLTPGGRLKLKVAHEIIRHKDIVAADAGLLDGVPQSWRACR